MIAMDFDLDINEGNLEAGHHTVQTSFPHQKPLTLYLLTVNDPAHNIVIVLQGITVK